MPRFGHVRGGRATLAATLLAATAGLVLTPAPAQAATNGITGQVTTLAGAGGMSCPQTGSADRRVSFRPDGRQLKNTSAGSGTVTSEIDPTDVSRWSASASSTVRSARTATTSSLAVTAAVRARITADLGPDGTGCRAGALASVVSKATVTVTRKGTLALTASTTGGAYLVLDLSSASGDAHPVKIIGSVPVGYGARIAVRPGTYLLSFQVVGSADVDMETAATGSVAGTAKATISVKSGKGRVTA